VTSEGRERPPKASGHLSGTRVAARLERSSWRWWRAGQALSHCRTLHRVGFT